MHIFPTSTELNTEFLQTNKTNSHWPHLTCFEQLYFDAKSSMTW